MFGWLRRRFLTGLVILLPTVLTGWILFQVFRSVDSVLRPVVARYPFLDFPGLGFLAVIVLILLTGVFAGNFIGRRIISLSEAVVVRVPLVNRMYTAIKQVSEVFLREERTVFKKAVLIEYPRRGIMVVGFVTSTWRYSGPSGEDVVVINVFLPTTPNPTSGLFLMIREEETIEMNCSVEEAVKMVISGGAVIPDIPLDFPEIKTPGNPR
jgi:uncharacterized membrane protein